MNPTISNGSWVSLPNEVRYRISKLFNIPKSTSTFVSDGVIESDGTTFEDLQHLTVEKMQKYLNDLVTTDFHKLFNEVVVKVTEELSRNSDTIVVSSEQPVEIVVEPKKRGRPSKK